MLRNLMEEKKLDFNAPLLSVRRFAPPAATLAEENKRTEKSQSKKASLPPYKPELKSGPVRNAGAVPFLWEQIPGRPKDGGGLRSKTSERPPLAPKLPPGRILDVNRSSSIRCAEDKESEASAVTRLPQAGNLISCPNTLSSGGNVKLETSRGTVKEENDPELDDCDDDAFSDALDTLSRTDSYFMNCSLTGMSALDGLDSKHSRNFTTDPQAREFMMDRFLPAAKAMASETPQYASRKQPVVREPVRPVNGLDRNRKPMTYQYGTYVVPHHTQDEEKEDSEDEDEDEDYDDTGNITAKACGLLPRFCLKNSFCLLNPVPGIKIRSGMPLSPVGRKLDTHFKPAGPGYLSEPGHENTWEAVYKHKLARGFEHPEARENGSKPTSESNQLTCWSDSQTPEGSSPYRRSTGDVISPYRNETPQSPFHEGMGFLGIPKQGRDFKDDGLNMYSKGRNDNQETLSRQSSKQGSGSGSPAIEKTLYVDSIQMLETPNSRSSSSDTKDLANSAEKDFEILVESERSENSPVLEARLGDVNMRNSSKGSKLNSSNGRNKLRPMISEIFEANPSSCTDGSILGGHTDNKEGFRRDDALDEEVRSLEFSKVLISGNLSLDDPQSLKEEDQGNSHANPFQSPLPPPLPKSPSESWLWRTLPSVSSTNPSCRPYLGIQFRSMKQVTKASSVDPKWETIVKTSNVQHGHLRFSEELKTPAKQSKT
ncbi:uncharacterized protein LOC131240988 [Magnolia sinica]|uniref:uncharacterized protein LOC131240988 n=1 Tax=Magnolia sinica TaxID=86752 RepID=UPI00265A3814|nr:uncharacterized protein LOC131240988 [Magnolia sinica]XP_058095561.1 uncharacterized protein LOC131240988 [Magnolia sinica]XP_058095562.1 uncharacterized protein LOC131240988 [Magnolia sinica]XP_058095563.1 uncharacterized protein LOC131240988 [Magnolia sinica]